MKTPRTLTIGMVVGEPSGDQLAAGLLSALRALYPGEIRVRGVVGQQLIAMGAQSLFAMERLAVMGFVEPLARLPELIAMRRSLKRFFLKNRPDIFIGVDAPDFNLGLECALRAEGILVLHYVSPSVWAWRRGRLRTIARAVDQILTLFPFEAKFYEQHAIPVTFVGHPLADTVPCDDQRASVRARWQISQKNVLALLPGSRDAEVKRLAPLFIQSAVLCAQRYPDLCCVIPVVAQRHATFCQAMLARYAPNLAYRIVLHGMQDCLMASDAVFVASGTATLEALLFSRPMVVAYRVNRLTYWLARWLVKVKWIALPNLLADQALVPELIQDQATPVALCDAMMRYWDEPSRVAKLQETYQRIAMDLRLGANTRAAMAVLKLLNINEMCS